MSFYYAKCSVDTTTYMSTIVTLANLKSSMIIQYNINFIELSDAFTRFKRTELWLQAHY